MIREPLQRWLLRMRARTPQVPVHSPEVRPHEDPWHVHTHALTIAQDITVDSTAVALQGPKSQPVMFTLRHKVTWAENNRTDALLGPT